MDQLTFPEPVIERREAVRYVGVARRGSGESAFRAAVDGAFPELFGWLSEQGVEPAGPPFIRYVIFEPDGAFDLELGVAVAGDVAGSGPVRDGVLPGGEYVVYVHAGAYSGDSERWAGRDLPAAYEHVGTWARHRGIAWETVETEAGTGVLARVERYLVGPPLESDVERWRTELLFLVKDGAATAS